jgi:hypothetical protein
LREWSVPEYGGWEKRMPKVVITITADEMPNQDFNRNVVIATAKALHELYCMLGPSRRSAEITVPEGTVKYQFGSVDEFQLGAFVFQRKDDQWNVELAMYRNLPNE